MENNQEVTAQGGRIGHRSGKSNRDPLLSVNIGAPKIFWNACYIKFYAYESYT